MPSARELLEQADALMRRNRLAAAPAEVSAPVAPTAPIAAAVAPIASAADDGIPVLTEIAMPPVALAVATSHEAAAAPAAQPAQSMQDLDDVPLLTDAVEEIEAPSILDSPDDEPSEEHMWTDTLTGSDPTFAEAPAPVEGTVAPAELTIVAMPAERTAELAGEAAPAFAATQPSDEPAQTVESIDITPPPEEPTVERRWYDPHEVLLSPPPAEELPLPETGTLSAPDAEPVSLAGAQMHAVPSADESQWAAATAPAAAAPDGAAPDEPAVEHTTGRGELHEVPAGTSPADTQPPVAPPATPHDDDARWAQLAEEVRMQVLQRIDLFTDTGLREQLAARLQPIVDRASADLVATINQHVGVLLRAYVAEAIEREIERWRAEGR